MYTSFEIANPNTKEKSHTFMLFGGDFYSKRLTVARLHIFSAQVALLEIKPWLAESYSAMKSTTWWSASSENTLQLPSVCIFKSSGPSRKRTLDCRPSQFYGLLINTHILYTKHKIIHSFTHCFKLHGLKQFKNNSLSCSHTYPQEWRMNRRSRRRESGGEGGVCVWERRWCCHYAFPFIGGLLIWLMGLAAVTAVHGDCTYTHARVHTHAGM